MVGLALLHEKRTVRFGATSTGTTLPLIYSVPRSHLRSPHTRPQSLAFIRWCPEGTRRRCTMGCRSASRTCTSRRRQVATTDLLRRFRNGSVEIVLTLLRIQTGWAPWSIAKASELLSCQGEMGLFGARHLLPDEVVSWMLDGAKIGGGATSARMAWLASNRVRGGVSKNKYLYTIKGKKITF